MQSVDLEIKGLYTAANDFTGAPKGGLERADECVIDQDNLLEPRRGFEALTYHFANTDDRGNEATNYQTYKIAHYGGDSVARYDNSTGWNVYSGTFNHPDTQLAKSRFMQALKNLYITTSTGVKKLDAYNGTWVAAGIPKGLDLQLALTGSSGFLGTNNALVTTGTTTNASPNLTVLASIVGIAAGQYVYGTGITAGTTVSSVTASATVLITTGTITAGSTSMTAVPTNSGLVVNQFVTGTGIQTGTRISALAGAGPYTVTLSLAAVATTTGVAVTFASDPVVTMSANATASNSGTSLTFSGGAQISYRGLFGFRDANNNLLYGAPSQLATTTNTNGTTTNVQVTMTIPSGITTAHFFQIYRSAQTISASVTPQDEMQLVYEGNPSAGDITNGYVQITDNTPDSLRGDFLYTNASQDGIAQAAVPPPYCKDFCAFRSHGFYANVKTKQRKKITLISASTLANDDTITINGVVYTAKATETVASGQYKLFTAGTPAQNITDTVNSLIKVINRYASNTTIYAYLISGPTDLPGQILLEERGTGGTTFVITVSAHGSAWTPTLPTSGSTIISSQDVFKNGIMISRDGEYEGVPEINILYAGDASKEILRIIPLREYIAVLSQDGVFRITGSSLSTFDCAPFDLTTKLIAPDTARAFSNEIWALFDQGLCAVSDTGVSVKDTPVQKTFKALIGNAFSTVQSVAFGVAYETDRRYILALPQTSGDTYCLEQYCFNTQTSTYTKWNRNTSGGFVNKDDDNKLYLFSGTDNTTSKERKDNAYTDYVDEGFAVTISAFTAKVVTLNSVSGVTVGDVLYQSSTARSVITAVDVTNTQVTVQDTLTWSLASASVLVAYESVIEWKPKAGTSPARVKQFSEGNFIFKRTRFNTATVAFSTDVSQSYEEKELTGFTVATWGNFPWGEEPWGGVNRPRPLRFNVPSNKQHCSQLSVRLTIRSGYASWALEGGALKFNDINEEVGAGYS